MASILIVEDNELNRELLSRRLAKKGFEVFEAVDAEQGLEMAMRLKPDLMMLDLGLPRMDGWELARRMQSMPETREVLLMALTAYAGVEEQERAREAGCAEVETKPFVMDRLMEKLGRLLESKSIEMPPLGRS